MMGSVFICHFGICCLDIAVYSCFLSGFSAMGVSEVRVTALMAYF